MVINNFKSQLESTLKIYKWSPTEAQLREIAKRFRALKGSPTKSTLEEIVLSVVGSYYAGAFEGLDNSDLRTLLALATKVEIGNDK